MLINHVGQVVELIARLDVVSTPPAALEERHVLVELVVLTGIDLSETLIVGSRGRASRQPQIGRQWIAQVIADNRSIVAARCGCCSQPGGLEDKIHTRGRPAKVVIIREEVAEASGGDDLRGQRDISADVVSRIRGRVAEAM